MLKLEVIAANAVKITAPVKLKADDFITVAAQIDSLISQHGQIRLLIDASVFSGWGNAEAIKTHVGFVWSHQRKVERIAIIAAHEWQHWLIAAVGIFVHPKMRAYDKGREVEALQWIIE
ncbi:MAG: STAS/SEC14 domain-containing protein [Roseiarcus sp.]